jgi:MFS family permease
VLPLLPALIERLLGAASTPGLVSRHTGLLTAVYALALFLTAPAWGRLSDRHGRRTVLLIALLGFSAATLVFSLSETLSAIYVQRFLTGTFAAGVTPIASAAIGDVASAGQRRGRQLAFVSMASIAGFLLGPTLGVFTARIGAALFGVVTPVRSIITPLTSTAILAFLGSVLVALTVPNGQGSKSSRNGNLRPLTLTRMPVTRLLILTCVVSASIGVFEVGLALRGTQELGFTPYEIALMFTECSLVMFVMQAVVFSPVIRAENTRWLITPVLFVLGVGLVLVPWASDFSLIVAVIGAVAGSAGIASPILTYWISTTSGSAQGWEFGRQTAAASLGVTIGSVAGGVLFNIGTVRGLSFLLAAGLVAASALLSLGLPRALVSGTEHPSVPGASASA